MPPTRLRRVHCAIAFLAILGQLGCSSQSVESAQPSPAASAQNADAIAEARAYAGRLYDSLALPGLAVAVAVADRIMMAAEFGYSDVEAKTPITPASQFRIGSVSTDVHALSARPVSPIDQSRNRERAKTRKNSN